MKPSSANESVVAFTFEGKRVAVSSGRDALRELCTILAVRHPQGISRLPGGLRYGKKLRFASSPVPMHGRWQIPGTDVWLDTKMNLETARKLAEDVVAFFGYNPKSLSFETSANAAPAGPVEPPST